MSNEVTIEEESKESFEAHCILWGYSTELDADGFYVNPMTQRLFNAYEDAWRASRAALVVELPDWSGYDTPRQCMDAVTTRLITLGVDVQ